MRATSLGSWLLLAAGGAALILASRMVREGEAEAPTGPRPEFLFPVTLAPVAEGRVEEWVSLVGDVLSSRRAGLALDRAGILAEVHADLGDRVAAGDLLAALDDRVLQEELAAARAAAAAAEAEADNAAREARRAVQVGPDVVPEQERERLETQARSAAARLDQARAEVRRLEALLERGRLRAPFAAAVVARYATLGSHVQAGSPVFEVLDLAHREVHVEVPASLAATLEPGAPVRIRADELPGLEVTASLDALVPAADPGSRSFTGLVRLDAAAPDAARLLPGMFVRVALLRRAATGPVVPVDALLEGRRGGGKVLVLAAKGAEGPPRAAFVPVAVRARDDLRAVVAPGSPEQKLVGGEVVVVGAGNLFPGAPLAPRPPAAAAGGEKKEGGGAAGA